MKQFLLKCITILSNNESARNRPTKRPCTAETSTSPLVVSPHSSYIVGLNIHRSRLNALRAVIIFQYVGYVDKVRVQEQQGKR